jgi:hypothetical protein
MKRILLSLALACLAAPAVAQEGQTRQCGTLDEVRTLLTDKYHEQPVGYGIAANGQVLMTVYANPDGSTWSIVMTRAKDGMACITAEGTDYQVKAPETGQGL